MQRKVWLFKGDSQTRSKLITRTFPDNTGRSTRRAKAAGDIPLYLLQTNALKDRINNALWREAPGPSYIHFPAWIGSGFYDELTYEERSPDGRWRKPGRGANEAFDLLVYADALVILHGYEKIKWPDAPPWARRETWLKGSETDNPRADASPQFKAGNRKSSTDTTSGITNNPWITNGGWL